MEVILREDVERLGRAGDIIKVKDGYARNFLIPRGFALKVTPQNLKVIESQRKRQKIQEEEELKKIQALADRLANASCTVAMAAGDDDKLFGTVTHADIADALRQEDIIVDKKDIVFDEEIHRLGIYSFKVKLHPDITPSVKLWVVKK